jgi:hypothetical protein
MAITNLVAFQLALMNVVASRNHAMASDAANIMQGCVKISREWSILQWPHSTPKKQQ